jgi:hypothetical protein
VPSNPHAHSHDHGHNHSHHSRIHTHAAHSIAAVRSEDLGGSRAEDTLSSRAHNHAAHEHLRNFPTIANMIERSGLPDVVKRAATEVHFTYVMLE